MYIVYFLIWFILKISHNTFSNILLEVHVINVIFQYIKAKLINILYINRITLVLFNMGQKTYEIDC